MRVCWSSLVRFALLHCFTLDDGNNSPQKPIFFSIKHHHNCACFSVKTNKPPVTNPPLTQISTRTTTKNCQFSFNVPNSNCQGGNSAVQQTLASLRQQLATARQQHQAQNAALQSVISTLQSQQSGYVTKIADLQNEVQSLVAAFNSLVSGQSSTTSAPAISTGPSVTIGNPSTFKQDIKNIQAILQNAMNDFESKIFNLSSVLNQNQIQESKVLLSLFI